MRKRTVVGCSWRGRATAERSWGGGLRFAVLLELLSFLRHHPADWMRFAGTRQGGRKYAENKLDRGGTVTGSFKDETPGR